MKAKLNRERLVAQAAVGKIKHPRMVGTPYRIDCDGMAHVLPATASITYNVKIGDSVFAMACDHVEPGVTIANEGNAENMALNTFSCVGNRARVISGEGKGDTGFVTGTHGGVEHVLVYFPEETLEKLAIEDKIQIRTWGQGAEIEGFEKTVKVMNLDPDLFDKMNVTAEDGVLRVPVAAKAPAHLMGSGIGAGSPYSGDYDIMTADKDELVRCGLDKLRYGDLVLLEDCDNTNGRGFLRGARTVGVVIHSDCIKAGHGPGVTALMSSKTPIIEGVISDGANIADLMGVK